MDGIVLNLRRRYRRVFVFIGNASKFLGNAIATSSALNSPNVTKILMLFRREKLCRWTLRLLDPKIIFATLRELVKQTAGQIYRDFSELKNLDDYIDEDRRVSNSISQWASRNLNPMKFTRILGYVISQITQG